MVGSATSTFAQSIAFDNSCGTNKWHGACANFVPPNTCFCENNWDNGTVITRNCSGCPVEPGANSDVFIGNIFVEADYTDPIRSITTTTTFRNSYIVDVSAFGLYNGPVVGRGAFSGAGAHMFMALVTPDSGSQFMDFRWPCTATFNGGLDIPPGAGIFFETEAFNPVQTTWRSSDTFYIDGAGGGGVHAVFHNQQGALFLATDDGEMRGLIGLGHFENAGTFRKDGGLAATTVGSEFKNTATGILDVRTGRLVFTSDSTFNGVAQLAANAELELRATVTVTSAFASSGAGVLKLPGTLAVNSNVNANIQKLDMGINVNNEVGRIAGAGSVNISDTAILGGSIIDGDHVTVLPGAQGSLNYHLVFDGTGSRLDNRGTLHWDQYDLQIAETCSVNNLAGALMECGGTGNAGSYFFTTGQMTNAGTLRKTIGGHTTISCPFMNAGIVEVTAGELDLRDYHQLGGGQLILNGGTVDAIYNEYRLHLDGGALRGNGVIRGHVDNNAATVAPGFSAGTVTIDGGVDYNHYLQGAAAKLDIEIGGPLPGVGYDQLVVNGAATIDGALKVRFINGYNPHGGGAENFDVLVCSNLVGQFATLDVPPCVTVTYLPDRVRITRTCASDITCNGATNVDDLLAVINAWGLCPAPPTACPSDIAPPGGNGVVNVDDLLKIINGWGGCP